jgi:hypothetical protein
MTQDQPAAPLRFDPSFEHPAPDEAETQASIDQTMHRIQQATWSDGGRPLRSVHAKAHGLLVGEFIVDAGLPPVLAQGVCAAPARHPGVLRLSTIPGDILPDDVSTPRGLALKLLDVGGARLPGSEGDATQDFLFVNGPSFQQPDARGFARSLKLLAATTDKAEHAKQLLSAVLRGAERLVEGAGGSSATLMALGGHPETNPLGDSWYSQVPVLWGEHFGKLSLRPLSPGLVALARTAVDLAGRPDGLREAIAAHFAGQGGEWELRVQLCTDIERMPIEDASKVWDEALSPYRRVARLVVPPQPAWDAVRARASDELLAFSPWHGIAAHRPLGSVMRLRRQAYANAQRFRAERNQRSLAEPRTLGELGLG